MYVAYPQPVPSNKQGFSFISVANVAGKYVDQVYFGQSSGLKLN